MLKREEIVNDTLVYDRDDDKYAYIIEVMNAIEIEDRDEGSDKHELSYGIVYLDSGEQYPGRICEYSGMTTGTLSVATIGEVRLHLELQASNAFVEMAMAENNLIRAKTAINNFERMIEKKSN